jgi:DNA-binding PadR family transcriptional regulator
MDDECCDMRGMLGFLILFLVSKKSMHGQEIADEITKRKGEKPSPGTLYPAIKNLREAGFLDEKKEGKTITYTLTPSGKKALTVAKRKFCKIFLGVFP